MDYPISVPSVGLVGGKFVDEDPLAGTPGSLIPAQWGNAVTDEILHVITAAGLVPDELTNTQLLAAIKLVVTQAGVTPGRLIGRRLITATGVYNPTPGTTAIYVKGVGGGASGGGTPATTGSQSSAAGGGGSGAYGEGWYTAGFAGVSVVIGNGGAAPAAGSNNGNNGSASLFGGLMTLPGGNAGNAGVVMTAAGLSGPNGGNTALPTGANLLALPGQAGWHGICVSPIQGLGGIGGSNPFGVGGHSPQGAGSRPAGGYGSGGSGATSIASSAAQSGAAGQPGFFEVWEYAA